jgi:hypothetical protein
MNFHMRVDKRSLWSQQTHKPTNPQANKPTSQQTEPKKERDRKRWKASVSKGKAKDYTGRAEIYGNG